MIPNTALLNYLDDQNTRAEQISERFEPLENSQIVDIVTNHEPNSIMRTILRHIGEFKASEHLYGSLDYLEQNSTTYIPTSMEESVAKSILKERLGTKQNGK